MSAYNKILAGAEDALSFVAGNEATVTLHEITPVDVKRIRQKTGLSQPKFAKLFQIAVGTLRNWEQGRRQPEGPAVALLRVIDKEPETTIRALHGS